LAPTDATETINTRADLSYYCYKSYCKFAPVLFFTNNVSILSWKSIKSDPTYWLQWTLLKQLTLALIYHVTVTKVTANLSQCYLTNFETFIT